MAVGREELVQRMAHEIENRLPGEAHITAKSLLGMVAEEIEHRPMEIPIQHWMGDRKMISWATAISWVMWLRGESQKKWSEYEAKR